MGEQSFVNASRNWKNLHLPPITAVSSEILERRVKVNNSQTGKSPDDAISSNLDRILLERDALLPSSGFAASVLDAVQQQTVARAPIPFPWRRALPGFAALLLGLAIVARMILDTAQDMVQSPATGSDWLMWLRSNAPSAVLLRTQAGPILLALAISYVCILLCRKFIGGSTTS